MKKVKIISWTLTLLIILECVSASYAATLNDVLSMIESWKNGQASLSQVIEVINEWSTTATTTTTTTAPTTTTTVNYSVLVQARYAVNGSIIPFAELEIRDKLGKQVLARTIANEGGQKMFLFTGTGSFNVGIVSNESGFIPVFYALEVPEQTYIEVLK